MSDAGRSHVAPDSALQAQPLVRPRALFSDVDRTLLTHDHVLPVRVVEAARGLGASGVRLMLASARSPVGIAPIAAALEAGAPSICFNGAWTGDAATGEVWDARPIPSALAHRAMRAARQLGAHPVWFTDRGAQAAGADAEEAAAQARTTGDPLRIFADGGQPDGTPLKIMAVASADMSAAIAAALSEQFGADLTVARSGPRYVEIVAAGTGKGHAARIVAERLGFDPDECAAAGDAENDLALLRWAGIAVTVENALAEIKGIARFVGASCDEGGMADAMAWLKALDAR